MKKYLIFLLSVIIFSCNLSVNLNDQEISSLTSDLKNESGFKIDKRGSGNEYGVSYSVLHKEPNSNFLVLGGGINGSTAGRYENNKGMTNLFIELENNPPFSIEYKAKFTGAVGWGSWKQEGSWCRSWTNVKEIKKVCIRLKGAPGYAVIQYRVRGVNNKWSGWKNNGMEAAPAGLIGIHVKQIEIKLYCPLNRFEDPRPRNSIMSYNFQGHFFMVKNGYGYLSSVSNDFERIESTFRLVEGLSNSGNRYVSFESISRPGYYLRHQGFRIKLHPYDGTELFRQDATFIKRPGLRDGSWISFESYNFPGYFIRHASMQLYVHQYHNSDLYRSDATFLLAYPNF